MWLFFWLWSTVLAYIFVKKVDWFYSFQFHSKRRRWLQILPWQHIQPIFPQDCFFWAYNWWGWGGWGSVWDFAWWWDFLWYENGRFQGMCFLVLWMWPVKHLHNFVLPVILFVNSPQKHMVKSYHCRPGLLTNSQVQWCHLPICPCN